MINGFTMGFFYFCLTNTHNGLNKPTIHNYRKVCILVKTSKKGNKFTIFNP